MKKNKTKKIKQKLILLLISTLTATAFAGMTAFADDGEKTVHLRIEGVECGICDGDFTTDAATLADFFRAADAMDDSFEIKITESQYGDYISAVNGDAAGAFGGYEGWLFTVNSIDPGVGMDSVEIRDGDSVVLYYGDPFGAGFQFPEADLSGLLDGVIKFISSDTVYDADFNASLQVNPVSEMSVKWYTGENEYMEYKTDENGSISIDAEFLTAGAHKVEFCRYTADGLPTVLRSAPGYSVTVEKDVTAGEGARGASPAAIMCVAAVVFAVLIKKEKNA